MKPHRRTRARRAAILLTMLVGVLGFVLGCGGGTSGRAGGGGAGAVATPSAPDTIVIDKFAYQPVPLTVARGARVTVINEDPVAHTLTAKDKSFDSGTIAGGERGHFTAPSKRGSYPYICAFHEYMAGTLIVR
ncbi:MAG: cupredoxin domain-containing protein [Actinobacteria bacterium]|jgi:plastocyanin|nr:cupredoxin domain-containing protein [Actinomycetota bacterium]